MMKLSKVTKPVASSVLVLALTAGCEQEKTISYTRDVKPILETYCTECHLPGGAGTEASGFSMVTYEDLMRGTANGPMIIAGDSLGSNMVVLMEGRADPSIKMPHGKAQGADKEHIETIRRWIDQGALNN